jgi:hypothetical protein
MTQQEVLEYLQKIYPDYNFRSGYIGNVGWCGNKYIDDRSFRIWCDDVYETILVWSFAPISIKLGSQEDIEKRSDQEWILLLMYAVKYIERMAQKEMNNA